MTTFDFATLLNDIDEEFIDKIILMIEKNKK